MRRPILLLLVLLAITAVVSGVLAQDDEGEHPYSGPEEGLGRAHMDVSCSPEAAAEFDRALALLQNFWYVRALERFNEIIRSDPECAIAYWGAAVSYNHPFWDAPTRADEAAAWTLVQKGMSAQKASPRGTSRRRPT